MIQGRDIVKRFGATTAVDGVTFGIMPGETYGLLGPNGAGKTTLMRLLSALSPLSSGELAVAGLDVTRQGRAVRERLGVVTQQDGLDTDLTVQQNLETYGYFSGLSRRESRRRAAEVLAFFGLQERAGDGRRSFVRRHETPPGNRPRLHDGARRHHSRRADHRAGPAGA